MLNRGDNLTAPYAQIRKFCKCAAGNYEYRDYRVNNLKSAGLAYIFLDDADDDNCTVIRKDTKSRIYSVKCCSILMNWYSTDKDYYAYV